MKLMRFALTAGSIATLVACGGSPSENTRVPLIGVFIDSPVEGLDYSTPTQSGSTDANGYFKYLDGENVTFSLYGMDLFEVDGNFYVTPFDSGASKNPNYAINLIRFMLAVDDDGDASNGIKLPEYTEAFDIDFNQSIKDFEGDADGRVAAFLSSHANGRELATVQASVAHFNSSIDNISPSYVLNLAGKTASSILTSTSCTNAVASSQISFGQDSAEIVGSTGFSGGAVAGGADGDCAGSPSKTLTIKYSEIPQGDFGDCLPDCDYKSLNKVSYVPNDFGGRTAVVWSWHTPNTKTIVLGKTILTDPANNNSPDALFTAVELITID